jgi:hypothetical protein
MIQYWYAHGAASTTSEACMQGADWSRRYIIACVHPTNAQTIVMFSGANIKAVSIAHTCWAVMSAQRVAPCGAKRTVMFISWTAETKHETA